MMYDKKKLIIKYINDRLEKLEELGKKYSSDKIEKLADNLVALDKPLEEIYALIDNKFSYQARKINHNNYLSSLKEYYLANIEKLKKGNNCYLLSYEKGSKVLEQARVKTQSRINDNLELVSVNKGYGYKKKNSKDNDYELIMSDIAYLLNIPYAKTYRMFDEQMNPIGILNSSMEEKDEKFLNLEEALSFVKEESNKFLLKNKIICYHDKNMKYGITEVFETSVIKDSIEYVFDLFACLPDITKENIEELKIAYLQVKVFEILTNSLNNTLTNYGIIVNKGEKKYTYRFAPTYNKYVTKDNNLSKMETICNFFIIDKQDLIDLLLKKYYKYIKEISMLVVDNNVTLYKIIDKLTKEHLEYEEYKNYKDILSYNYNLFESAIKKLENQDIDKTIRENNNDRYLFRIAPYLDNYNYDAFDESLENKGSVLLVGALGVVLIITIVIIGFAIYIVSKVGM